MVESSETEQEKGFRGRGATGKQNVAVMTESTSLDNIEIGKKSKSYRCFKAIVLETHFSLEIHETIKESIDKQKIVFKDKKSHFMLILPILLNFI